MASGKTDPAEQVKFLVSCISHTNNGRPDFTAVATELGIVTKAAAQKRYERMLKAYNVMSPKKAAAAGEAEDSDAPVTPKNTPKKKQPVSASAKKRAASEASGGTAKKRASAKAPRTPKKESSDDEDTKAPKVDGEAKKSVKEEEANDSPLSDAPNTEDSNGFEF